MMPIDMADAVPPWARQVAMNVAGELELDQGYRFLTYVEGDHVHWELHGPDGRIGELWTLSDWSANNGPIQLSATPVMELDPDDPVVAAVSQTVLGHMQMQLREAGLLPPLPDPIPVSRS